MPISCIFQQPLFDNSSCPPSTGLLLMPAIKLPAQAADYTAVFRFKVKLRSRKVRLAQTVVQGFSPDI